MTDKDYIEPEVFETDAGLSINETWFDWQGNLMITSNKDKTTNERNIVVVPKHLVKRFIRFIRNNRHD